ncbi:MAG: mannosyltransferase [Flavobacteriaceae bacterium]|jgi:mannosyltransferase
MKWNNLILPAGILLLNVVIKLLFIDQTAIGGDEPFTLFYAQTDYETLFAMLETENNPPLYTFIMKYWIQFFGNDVLTVRILPLLFSSFTAVGIYQLGRLYWSRFVGITAALIFTFANYHIYFSHESRPYALFAMLTVFSILVFLQVTIDGRKRRIYLLALLNVLLIYNHFFGFFVLFVQFLSFLIIRPIRTSAWKPLFISWGLVVIGYLPYIPFILKRFGHASGGTWLKAPPLDGLYTNLWNFSNQPINVMIALSVFLAAIVLWVIRKREIKKPAVIILVIWFLIPYFLMFALSFKIPMFLDRYLVYISIAYYLLIAVSMEYIAAGKNYKWFFGGALVILMACTSNFNSGNTRNDDQLVKEIISSKSENTAVILCPDWYFMTFSYHYDRSIFNDYRNSKARLEAQNIFPRAYLNSNNNSQILNKEHVIFVNTGAYYVDPKNKIQRMLLDHFVLTSENYEFEPYVISHYRKKVITN